jgi:hypothetical protein
MLRLLVTGNKCKSTDLYLKKEREREEEEEEEEEEESWLGHSKFTTTFI